MGHLKYRSPRIGIHEYSAKQLAYSVKPKDEAMIKHVSIRKPQNGAAKVLLQDHAVVEANKKFIMNHYKRPLAAPPTPSGSIIQANVAQTIDQSSNQKIFNKPTLQLYQKSRSPIQYQPLKGVILDSVNRSITPVSSSHKNFMPSFVRVRLNPAMQRTRNAGQYIETSSSNLTITCLSPSPIPNNGKLKKADAKHIYSALAQNRHKGDLSSESKVRIKVDPNIYYLLQRNLLAQMNEGRLSPVEQRSFASGTRNNKLYMGVRSSVPTNQTVTPLGHEVMPASEQENMDDDDRLTVIEKDCENDYSLICESLKGPHA